MIQQIAFIIALAVAVYFLRNRVLQIRNTIRLGKNKLITDRPSERFWRMILMAFGQKKMFKRPIPAVLHFRPDPPYATGVAALRDGWRLIQASALPPPAPETARQVSYLKHEFVFEKLVDT
jgi:hypothetical protein